MDKKLLSYGEFLWLFNPHNKIIIDGKNIHDNSKYLNLKTKAFVKKHLKGQNYLAFKAFHVLEDIESRFLEKIHRGTKTIIFSECFFDLGLSFSQINNFENLVFIGCHFSRDFRIIYPNYNIFFIDSEIGENLEIRSNDLTENKVLVLEDCRVKKELLVSNQEGLSELRIEGIKSRYENGIRIKNCKISTFVVDNINFAGTLIIDWDKSKNENNSFDNIFIKESLIGDLQIRQTKVNERLSLENVKIVAEFILQACNIKSVILKSKLQVPRSFIRNCFVTEMALIYLECKDGATFEITESTKIQRCELISVFKGETLLITEGSKISEFHSNIGDGVVNNFNEIVIRDSSLEKGYFNNIHTDSISFHSNSIIKFLAFNSSVLGEAIMQRCEIDTWIIEKSIFESNLKVIDTVISSLVPQDIIVKGITSFTASETKGTLKWSCCILVGKLYFDNSKLNNLSFEKSLLQQMDFLNKTSLDYRIIRFENCVINMFRPLVLEGMEYYISNSTVNSLEVNNLSFSKSSTLSLSNTYLNNLNIRNSNLYGQVYFRNCQPNEKYLDKITPSDFNRDFISKTEGFSSWEKVERKGVLFSYSSLGETEFIEFGFEDYEFEFNNTKLIECFIAGSQFPDAIEIANIKKGTKEYYNQKVLVYNQLKKIAERNGDIVKSSLMHSRALESQHQVLKKTSNKHTERFIFWANKWSNNHGESWPRAFCFTFFGALVFFVPYIICEGKYGISGDFDGNIITDFLKFIDPFKKLDYSQHWGSNFIYFFNKIWFSYGVVQLVTAFRRHGKK
jgi:hypothetical protein